MRKKNKLVCGVGINDANYVTQLFENLVGKQKRVWICPYYFRWKKMLERCYSDNYQNENPTYLGCYVCEEWKTFSNFKAWMEKQDWEENELDKDLLIHGNKEYCPDNCIFISKSVNLFMVERTSHRGAFPIGVYFDKRKNKFRSRCRNSLTEKQEHLGYYDTPKEAHQAWLKRKRELAHQLAALQTDPRVAKALIDRYDVDEYIPLHT